MKNINLAINHYLQNKDEIHLSISKRNALVADMGTLDNRISELKKTNREINEASREKNTCKDKTRNIELRERVKELNNKCGLLEESIKQTLQLLPNVLSNESKEIEEDKCLFEKGFEVNEDCRMTFCEFGALKLAKCVERTYIAEGEACTVRMLLQNYFVRNNFLKGFEVVSIPLVTSREILEYSGHLPRFRDGLFEIKDGVFLIPTGEIGLFEHVIKNNIEEARLFALSACFRNEDSAPGKINKMMIRQGQFEKVETFVVCPKEKREEEFSFLVENVKGLLDGLKFKYRIVNVCPREMSSSAAKQLDFEVWFPASKMFVEIASCSDCGDYQTMRAGIKGELNTLNCSALPVDRVLAAYIEYYYDKHAGSFELVDVLR